MSAPTLQAWLAGWQGFSWPTANCAHFAVGWAAPAALAGVAMPASARELRRTLRALGAGSLRQAVTQRLGPEIAPALARRGDVVLVRRTLGLCIGGRAAVPLAGGGLAFVPMRLAGAAWRRP